jgi:biotin carboxylase
MITDRDQTDSHTKATASPPRGSAGRTKRLLLLFTTTGYNAKDFVEAAEKLGVEVVVGTDRCHVLDDPWQDAAIPLRFSKPAKSSETICHYARKQPIDGIVAIGDKPTVTAALASRALGLPGNPPRAVAACRNKFQARRLLKKANVPVPNFRCHSIHENPRALASSVRFPCVLKPLALSASQGVIRADGPAQFESAFQRICQLLRTPEILMSRDKSSEHILVEDFVEGDEVALEGILSQGQLQVLALFDKPDPLNGPFFEETIYVTPSRQSARVQDQIADCTRRAAEALGLFEGPIHAELRINALGPWILELAARSIGGLCSRTLRFGVGMSLEEIIIRHALKIETKLLQRESRASGVMMIPIPAAGYLHEVSGQREATAVVGIEEVTITAKIGQKMVPLPEGSSYLGFIFARGNSPKQVEKALRLAHQKLRFEISPSLPVLSQE